MWECLICVDDYSDDEAIEFRLDDLSETWCDALFCASCIEVLRKTQFHKYVNDVNNADCAKTQRELLKRGPPINVYDKHGFPGSEGKEILSLRYKSTQQSIACKLDGSLDGDERLKFWEHLREFAVPPPNEDPID